MTWSLLELLITAINNNWKNISFLNLLKAISISIPRDVLLGQGHHDQHHDDQGQEEEDLYPGHGLLSLILLGGNCS